MVDWIIAIIRKSLLNTAPGINQDSLGLIMDAVRLFPVFEDRETTVLIAPNDWYAATYRRRLSQLGYSIPRDISLIGFDNKAKCSLYPLTSVEPNFDSLGYQAFHALLRDIPTQIDSDGRIPA